MIQFLIDKEVINKKNYHRLRFFLTFEQYKKLDKK